MGAMKHYLMEQDADETNARCWSCDEPFGTWSAIRGGRCPACKAPINARDRSDGWCLDCGKPLRGEEAGLEQCFDCRFGGPGYD
jgi:predicted amidophosphoribosyltransferase